MKSLSVEKRKRWCDLLIEVDIRRSSKKAWNLIKHLDRNPKEKPKIPKITSNQIAHHLLVNGKNKLPKSRPCKPRVIRTENKETHERGSTILFTELEDVIDNLNNGKAAGLDDMFLEQIKHFGRTTKIWLLNLFNSIRVSLKIPKIWRKAKVIALLKPGKKPDMPSNYLPVSLLCHTYNKLYERIFLNRLNPTIDDKFIKEQAGFRPGNSCTGQVLNLTQYIENGFEKKKVTGVSFIDLSSVYDTINHGLPLFKVYQLT